MTATIWDTAHKDSSIVLGRGATIAGRTSGAVDTFVSVRATTSLSTGKKCFELYVNSWDNNQRWSIGLANSTFAVTNRVGSDANSLGFLFRSSNSALYYNNFPVNGTHALWSTPNALGCVVFVAVDLDNKLIWFKTDRTTNWNNNGSADPATGVGGLSYTVTGALFPVFSPADASESNVCTLNAGAYPFSLSIPSGFSAWDTGLPSPNGRVGTSPTTWNPSDKDTHVALSGGNLVATQSSDANVYDGVRSTTSYGSGQVYFETTVTTLGTGNSKRGWVGGFGTASASLSSAAGVPGADFKSIGYQMGDLNDIIYNTTTFATYNGSQTQGDVYGVAVDFNKGLWWVKNVTTNSNWNNNASADPVAGVGGFGLPTTQDLFAMWGGAFASSTTDAVTANFGVTGFVGTAPSGYTAWDSSTGGPRQGTQQIAVTVICG